MAVSAAIRETAAAREAPTAALAAAKKTAAVREAAAAREAAVVREAGAPTAALAAGGQLEGPPEEPDWQAFLTAASFLVTSSAAAAEASAGTTEAKPALVSLYTHSYFRAGHALIIFQMPQRLCRVHASYFFYMFQHRSNIQFDVNLVKIVLASSRVIILEFPVSIFCLRVSAALLRKCTHLPGCFVFKFSK